MQLAISFNLYAECFEWIQVCYVAFWDDITLSAQESERKKIGQDGFIEKWRVVVVKELPFTDQRLNGKIPKVGSANIGPEFLLKIQCKVVHSLLIYKDTDTHTNMHTYAYTCLPYRRRYILSRSMFCLLFPFYLFAELIHVCLVS